MSMKEGSDPSSHHVSASRCCWEWVGKVVESFTLQHRYGLQRQPIEEDQWFSS